jgi:hypothetical protein
MKWLKDNEISDFLSRRNYDVRISHNARWLDQKCAASGDYIPKNGTAYIFYAVSQPDGSMRAIGMSNHADINVTKAADDSQKSFIQSINKAPAYTELIDAFANEKPYGRKRYKSIYDAEAEARK